MRVMKFGGTSVAGAERLHAVSQIIIESAHQQPVLVVVSAFRGVTDLLLELARRAASGRDWKEGWEYIVERHRTTAYDLGLRDTADLDTLFSQLHDYYTGIALLGECTPRLYDCIAAYGELMSSFLLSRYLIESGVHCVLFDARKAIKTNAHFTKAKPEWELIRISVQQHLQPLFNHSRIIITQGFIGSTATGMTTTLARGGSDFSASIFGACLQAECIEIWTDVPGIMTADPRIVPNAEAINEITLDEVAALSAYGAKVLHPDTVKPAIEYRIPVCVRNTFQPHQRGTNIVSQLSNSVAGIRAVTLVEECMLINSEATDSPLVTCNCHAGSYSIVQQQPLSGYSEHGLICAVGANIHADGEALRAIAAAARLLSCHARVVASTSVCVLIVVEQHLARPFLLQLHHYIRLSQIEEILC